MNTLVICLACAALLPFLAKLPLMLSMKEHGGYDNHNPRSQQSKLTGFGARALAGHQNAFEALIIFTAAVSVCLATGSLNSFIEILAVSFIALRVLYHILYLKDKATLRSLTWALGMTCSFIMLLSPIFL